MVIRISYFILASLLTFYLKVGGSVLKDEPIFGFDLHYAATLHVDDEFVTAFQTKNASQDISCKVGHNFKCEMKILPQDLNFAQMEQAIGLNIALEKRSLLWYSFVEKGFEMVRHFSQGIEMVMESTMCFNVQVVYRWAYFRNSQINDSAKAEKSKLLAPMVLLSNFKMDNGTNFREDGKVAAWTEAECTVEEAALDFIDTEGFKMKRLNVTDLEPESYSCWFERIAEGGKNRWANFEAARASNNWEPDGMILTSFVRKDGSKKPSKPNYAGADEEDFGLTAISANVQEFIGQEKWQGNGKQGKSSAARAKETAQQSATPRGKGGKGNGGGGGGWKARSGGAAAVESDEMTIEELKSQLMEQKAAATEARLKLLESQAAARSQGLGP